MKKTVMTLFAVILAAFAVFVLTKPLFNTSDGSSTSQEDIDFDDISVLIQGEEPTDGVYTDFVLCVGDTKVPFQGRLLAHRTDPQIYCADLTSDGHKDIIVTLQSGAGTGCYEEDVHIFDGVTLKEYAVEFLPESIDAYAEASTKNGVHTITISGKEYVVNTDDLVGYDPSEAEHFYIDKQYYAYRVSDEKLRVLLSCGIWNYGSCGYLEVTFEPKESTFVFSSAVFVPSGSILP